MLGNLIERIGLEDSGELVAFATSDQLAAVFDQDLWRSARVGEDERFDADRFLTWLAVMLEAGDAIVAQRLAELPIDLVTLAFHEHVLVLDMDALAQEMEGGGEDVDAIEKALSDSSSEELEEYRIIARRHEGWDDLLTAILALDRDDHGVLVKILDRCAKMDAEIIEDNGGLYEVLTSEEMLEGDLAAEREDRRAEAGYVAPSSAAAFLKLAKKPVEGHGDRDPLTRAYFRSLAPAGNVAPAAPRVQGDLMELLHDAEVVPREPPRLTAAADATSAEPAILRAMRDLAERDPKAFAARSEEIAYLANVLEAGCPFRGRRLRPVEAIRAAIATCNLGLELAAEGRDMAAVLVERSADLLFRLAWHRVDVERHLAEVLEAKPRPGRSRSR